MDPPEIPDVRAAESLTFAGEAFTVQLTVEARAEGTALPDWSDPSFRTKLDDAAAQALKKSGLAGAPYEGFSMTARSIDPLTGRIGFVTHGYARAEGRSGLLAGLTQEGARFEAGVLSVLRELDNRVGTVLAEASVPVTVRASWAPGSGLSIGERTDRPADLRRRAASQQRRQRGLARMAWVLVGVAVLVVTLFLLFSLSGESFYGIFGMYPFFFVLFALMLRSMAREAELDARSLSDEADISELVSQEDERRAQKQLQVHSHELERYYEPALRQRRYIFSVGVLCIVGGFGAVGAAFALVADDQVAPETTDKVIIATLGVVSGILANFVAVMFLRMFSATVNSMTVFHTRLVRTHHVHIGNLLAAKVRDPDRRDTVLSEMALALAGDLPGTDSTAGSPEKGSPAGR